MMCKTHFRKRLKILHACKFHKTNLHIQIERDMIIYNTTKLFLSSITKFNFHNNIQIKIVVQQQKKKKFIQTLHRKIYKKILISSYQLISTLIPINSQYQIHIYKKTINKLHLKITLKEKKKQFKIISSSL